MTTALSAHTAPHHASNRAFYDRISAAYDTIADSNERVARICGLNALNLQPGERLLEIGFGTGNEILDAAEKVGATGTVTGVDISSGMLAVAQEKFTKRKPLAPLDLKVADARELPFADGSFDTAYSSFTLELFPPEEVPVVLKEILRVLKPGGRFGVVSMAKVRPGDAASTLENIYIWMHRHFPHIVDCRPIDVEARLAEAGFQIAEATRLSIWSMPVVAAVGLKKA